MMEWLQNETNHAPRTTLTTFVTIKSAIDIEKNDRAGPSPTEDGGGSS